MPFFETDFAEFHYYEYGSGSRVMLAFHGFGMKGTQFKILEEAFGKIYKIYSFDAFFHGGTVLKNGSVKHIRKGLGSEVFAAQITAFLKSKGFDGESKFSLLSYSMGAKLAWSLISELPHRISSTYFIAPDGIRPNRLLAIGAGNRLVNRLFYFLVYSPRLVRFLLNTLYRFRYIDASLHRILNAEFNTVETRTACYNAITFYNRLLFKKQGLARLVNQYPIDCHFYFGKKDRLFPGSIGLDFAQLLDKPSLHIFDEGHELVNSRLNEYLILQLQAAND